MRLLPIMALLLVLALASAGCASKEEVQAYYDAQLQAAWARADAVDYQKPLVRMVAKKGEKIELKGVAVFEVYGPSQAGAGGQDPFVIHQHKDPVYGLASTVLGVGIGAATVWLSGQNMVDLANAVGTHAGHNVTVGGSQVGGGQTNIGGDSVGGDKAGRDIIPGQNRDSHDSTTEVAE